MELAAAVIVFATFGGTGGPADQKKGDVNQTPPSTNPSLLYLSVLQDP
jgi:hypothetical protein